MQRRQLPIGIQHFRTLWEDSCHYVDKTPPIHRLLSHGRSDMVLLRGGQVFIMEFKMVEGNEAALDREERNLLAARAESG